jgi:biotin carboxyl carrier protein
MKCAACLATLAMLVLPQAWADELILKDGTKIVGNIVGYEGDSFKVETSYGFAIVKKEKVAHIIIGDAKLAPPEKKPPAAPSTKVSPAPAPAEVKKPPESVQPRVEKAEAPPPLPPAPAKVSIREEIEGTVYTNHTYGFRMYKPPSWRMIEDARKSLPTAVVAMGTTDENTLFIVGKEALRGTLETHAAQTERSLQEIYQDYRSLDEKQTRVAGVPAIERRFRGTADGRAWSAVFISFARGSELFTILGMTTAGTDLIQIQENVISRTIASLEFLK